MFHNYAPTQVSLSIQQVENGRTSDEHFQCRVRVIYLFYLTTPSFVLMYLIDIQMLATFFHELICQFNQRMGREITVIGRHIEAVLIRSLYDMLLYHCTLTYTPSACQA